MLWLQHKRNAAIMSDGGICISILEHVQTNRIGFCHFVQFHQNRQNFRKLVQGNLVRAIADGRIRVIVGFDKQGGNADRYSRTRQNRRKFALST